MTTGIGALLLLFAKSLDTRTTALSNAAVAGSRLVSSHCLFAWAFGLDVGLALAGVLAGPRMSGSAYRFSR
jgi:hypothetical protein